jgi:arylsulfatase
MGLYADSIAEIEWSVGKILEALKKYALEKNTLVIFTSDNGPAFGEGSTGGLRGRKGSTYEGGVRVPFAARWPGHIPAGIVSNGVAATIDLLPTFANLAGASMPSKPLDGVDIWPMFIGKQKQMERDVLLYWEDWNLTAARLGKWKLRFKLGTSVMAGGGQSTDGGQQGDTPSGESQGASASPGEDNNNSSGETRPMGGLVALQAGRVPSLHNLELDPDESYNAASDYPDIVEDITHRVEKLVPGFPEEVQKAWADIKSKWTTTAGNPQT